MAACGICGVVALGRPAEAELVRNMSDALAHRGPDGAGHYEAPGVALGHRRLAIIDLSDAGLQPFASEDGLLQLIHNGEVYNYRELRTELEARGRRFRSATDTEVVLAAYEEWGDRCVERFNGMWAFAIWDGRAQRLFCSRDRFGVKPFYYRFDGGRLSFASELKAFRADPECRLEPNLGLVRDYVARDWFDHTDETFFEGIRKLPPAHSLVLDRSGLRLQRYWRLERRDPPPGDPVDTVRELFLDSVRLRLRSDVRVGTCLSGGIDSSAIACGVDHLLRTEVESRDRWATARRRSPSTSTSGYDERPYARAVVDRTLATPTWISFNGNELVAQLPGIVEAHDEPFRSTSICAGWFVMRAAREAGVTVVLDGQGGDEVFAGYPAYYAARYADLLAKGRAGEVARELAGQARAQGAGRTATMFARALAPAGLERLLRARRSESDALLHPDLRRAPETVERVESPYTDRLRMLMTRILTVRGLPELLHAEDRNSMAHSLEARVPFLDYRLVELSFSLDGGRLLERGTTKAILRRALADLLPPSVAARTDKLGFVTPEALWLRGPLGGVAADAFASQRFADRGFVDVAAARRRLERTERASSGRVRALARSTSNCGRGLSRQLSHTHKGGRFRRRLRRATPAADRPDRRPPWRNQDEPRDRVLRLTLTTATPRRRSWTAARRGCRGGR